MTTTVDLLLVLALALDLLVLSSSRLAACIRATALQGVALSLMPLALLQKGAAIANFHILAMTVGTLLVKGIAIPYLLHKTSRDANVRREVEPFVSLHLSVLLGAILVGMAFWLAEVLVLPVRAASALLVPVAFATVLLGFLVLVTRRKAIMQVVGYLMLENGIFVFGQCLAEQMPVVIELGLLLDLLVGIFVFGIAIHEISREFDNIDTDVLSSLRD